MSIEAKKFTAKINGKTSIVAEIIGKGKQAEYFQKDETTKEFKKLDIKNQTDLKISILSEEMWAQGEKETLLESITENRLRLSKEVGGTLEKKNESASTNNIGDSVEYSTTNDSQIPQTLESSNEIPHFGEYAKRMDQMKKQLNPSEISMIPETVQTKNIPEKKPGTTRILGFGDTDKKTKGNSDQAYIRELQKKSKEWDCDIALSVGDHIYDRGGRSNEKYKQAVAKARGEFQNFGDIPFAITMGNHDINHHGQTDKMTDAFKDKLENFEETPDSSAYGFTKGGATFVVFNEGNRYITDSQIAFFKKKSAQNNGAVYLVNHIPPFQDAFGAGLSESGKRTCKNFDKIQKFAKESLENRGRPFYIFSGDTHFAHAVGNFLNPGATGEKYYGLPGKRLQAVPSAAVVDMDSKTGKITAVYFRAAEQGFDSPLPEEQSMMAQMNKNYSENRLAQQ